jgi:hypothetical protein
MALISSPSSSLQGDSIMIHIKSFLPPFLLSRSGLLFITRLVWLAGPELYLELVHAFDIPGIK